MYKVPNDGQTKQHVAIFKQISDYSMQNICVLAVIYNIIMIEICRKSLQCKVMQCNLYESDHYGVYNNIFKDKYEEPKAIPFL